MRRLNLEKIAFIERFPNDFVHVIGLVGIGGDQRVEAHLDPVPIVRRRPFGQFGTIARGQKIDQVARRQ